MTVVEEGSGPSAKPDVVHAQPAEIIGDGGTQFTIKLHVVGLLVFSGMEGDSHRVLLVQLGRYADGGFQVRDDVSGAGIDLPVLDKGPVIGVYPPSETFMFLRVSPGKIIFFKVHVPTDRVCDHVRIYRQIIGRFVPFYFFPFPFFKMGVSPCLAVFS